jgi:hypothetical protein|tara:strand:+ start:201 stop:335 length:135 start_codon:yes stop_codon:yes gene_type:complete
MRKWFQFPGEPEESCIICGVLTMIFVILWMAFCIKMGIDGGRIG